MRRKMGKLAGLTLVFAAALLATPAGAMEIRVARIDAQAGGPAAIDVILATSQGEVVAGTQNDITFDETIVSASAASICRINAAISDSAPPSCDDDPTPEECNCKKDPPVGPCKQLQRDLADVEGGKRFRGLVVSIGNTNPINDPSADDELVLYTCTFQVAVDAEEGSRAPLVCSLEGGSDPDGKACGEEDAQCNAVTCSDGEVHIVVAPTPTSTATATTEATDTPTVGTATPTRTNTRPVSGDTDDDGCQAVAPVSSHTGWLLFAPAALLLWSRRRSR